MSHNEYAPENTIAEEATAAENTVYPEAASAMLPGSFRSPAQLDSHNVIHEQKKNSRQVIKPEPRQRRLVAGTISFFAYTLHLAQTCRSVVNQT